MNQRPEGFEELKRLHQRYNSGDLEGDEFERERKRTLDGIPLDQLLSGLTADDFARAAAAQQDPKVGSKESAPRSEAEGPGDAVFDSGQKGELPLAELSLPAPPILSPARVGVVGAILLVAAGALVIYRLRFSERDAGASPPPTLPTATEVADVDFGENPDDFRSPESSAVAFESVAVRPSAALDEQAVPEDDPGVPEDREAIEPPSALSPISEPTLQEVAQAAPLSLRVSEPAPVESSVPEVRLPPSEQSASVDLESLRPGEQIASEAFETFAESATVEVAELDPLPTAEQARNQETEATADRSSRSAIEPEVASKNGRAVEQALAEEASEEPAHVPVDSVSTSPVAQGELSTEPPSAPNLPDSVPSDPTQGEARAPEANQRQAANTESAIPTPVASTVVEPSLIGSIQPRYPSSAKAASAEGTAEFRVLISMDGRVAEMEQLGRRLGFGLDRAAVIAIRSSRWRPAARDGRPMARWVHVTVTFQP